MKMLLTLALALMSQVSFAQTCQEWDAAKKESIIKNTHVLEESFHAYHEKYASLASTCAPKKDCGFDKQFLAGVHMLEKKMHAFEAVVVKAPCRSGALSKFNETVYFYKKLQTLFTEFATKIHSNQAAGMDWKKLELSFESLSFEVRGAYTWCQSCALHGGCECNGHNSCDCSGGSCTDSGCTDGGCSGGSCTPVKP